jgi:hypothetical protein
MKSRSSAIIELNHPPIPKSVANFGQIRYSEGTRPRRAITGAAGVCSKAYWAPLRGSIPREYQIAKVPGWVA